MQGRATTAPFVSYELVDVRQAWYTWRFGRSSRASRHQWQQKWQPAADDSSGRNSGLRFSDRFTGKKSEKEFKKRNLSHTFQSF
jgi:transposase